MRWIDDNLSRLPVQNDTVSSLRINNAQIGIAIEAIATAGEEDEAVESMILDLGGGLGAINDDNGSHQSNLTVLFSTLEYSYSGFEEDQIHWKQRLGDEVEPAEAELEFIIADLVSDANERSMAAHDEAHDLLQFYTLGLGTFLAVVVLIGFFLAGRMSRRLSQPLVQIADAAESASRGDWEQEIDVPTRPMEIQSLAQSFDRLITSTKWLMEGVQSPSPSSPSTTSSVEDDLIQQELDRLALGGV